MPPDYVGLLRLEEHLRHGNRIEGPAIIEKSITAQKVALVLGAEGKGLRQKTRETVDVLARLDMPGAIRSLNVSNAAVLSLYVARHIMVELGNR